MIIIFFACSKEEVSELQSDYFIKFYGNFLEDNGYAIRETGDGGLIITGTVERLSTGKDIVLIKTDAYGNQADWSPKYFGNGSDDEAYSVVTTEDGYLIAGTITNDGNKDAILIQTDLQGNQVGEEFIYGGSEDQYAVDIEERSQGGHMVVGYSINPSDQSRSFFVITLDEGLTNPKITTSSSRGEEFIKVIRNTESEYLALGNQYRADGDSRFFIAKLNETGNIFDLAFISSPNSSITLGDAVATNDSTLYLYGTLREEGEINSKLILKKVVNLQESWDRVISASGSLEGKAITTGSDGELIIAADKTLGEDKNILIYFLDEEGNVVNSREFGESGDQTVEDILHSQDNLIILGGNAYEQNRMISLIKTDQQGNIWE